MNNKSEGTGWSTHYYELPPDATELQDLIEYREMNFALGNIFKACWRLGEKSGTDELYDLKKIKWFAQREINRLEKFEREEEEYELSLLKKEEKDD